MAQASKKKMGVGSQGKQDGSGAMTVLAEGVLPENMVLSNRDKSMHSGERGLDSRQVQTEQYHDHVGAHGTLAPRITCVTARWPSALALTTCGSRKADPKAVNKRIGLRPSAS